MIKNNNNNYDSLERISLFFSLFGSLIFILDFWRVSFLLMFWRVTFSYLYLYISLRKFSQLRLEKLNVKKELSYRSIEWLFLLFLITIIITKGNKNKLLPTFLFLSLSLPLSLSVEICNIIDLSKTIISINFILMDD